MADIMALNDRLNRLIDKAENQYRQATEAEQVAMTEVDDIRASILRHQAEIADLEVRLARIRMNEAMAH
jgi:peptidoglycan hydrolase CwlO-like protein